MINIMKKISKYCIIIIEISVKMRKDINESV